MLRETKTVGQLVSEYGVPKTVLYHWREQALAGLPTLFGDQQAQEQIARERAWQQERETLFAEIGRLTTQLTWLKRNLVSTLSRTERQGLIEWEGSKLSVTQQADPLAMHRGTLSSHPMAPASKEVALKHRIDAIYTEAPVYGYRRITAQLHREGWEVNRKTVARYMREMRLVGIHPGPNLSKRDHAAGIYPYLLRHVTARYPDHVWGIDITYVKLRDSWLYLVAVMDWYSRYVLSWQLDQTLAMPFVLDAVDRAFTQAVPIIWKSDQGSHFTSPQYVERLQTHGVHISMDGRGRALDTIFTERLWRTSTYEEMYLKEYASPHEAHVNLTTYLQWYNHQRRHQSLNYQPPAAVYKQG